MKFVTFRQQGVTRIGVVEGEHVVDLALSASGQADDIGTALRQGVDLFAAGKQAQASARARLPLASLDYAPVVPNPGKIICLGLNYYDHAKEGGREKPEYPWFFFRGATSLVAHGEAGIRPRVSTRFDYEAELGVVIGKRARHLSQADALSCVFGYTCFNDMSVRDYQKKTPQWTIGKNFDGTGGLGPVLVSADELPAGAEGLSIRSVLNGQIMQDANTRDMIWGVAETIALLTECLTLEPGDVIAMGTPAGVGQARTPPVWMRDGDDIEIQIESVGTLKNPIRDEA